MKRVGTLEIDEDVSFTRREWMFERCGWVLLLLLVVGGLTGAFGSGILSEQTLSAEDGTVTVKHSKVVRQQTSRELEIEFRGSGSPLFVRLSPEFYTAWRIEQVTPEPAKATAGLDGIAWHFEGEGPARIRIGYKSAVPGTFEGEIQLSRGRTVRIKQTTLP